MQNKVTIKDLTFKNAGFWTIQLLYSSYLTVNGVVIKNNEDGSGPSTDGIDVDSSTWTLDRELRYRLQLMIIFV
jgi:polygalacturonase